jgi:DNA invertase Pin-like site-specific DNA recombinase
LPTKAEKENRVIELYEQDKTYREIVKEVHMSLGDISSIIKRHTGEINAKAGNGDILDMMEAQNG